MKSAVHMSVLFFDMILICSNCLIMKIFFLLPQAIFQSQSNESIWSQPLIKFLSQFSVTPHDYYLVSNRKVFFWKCVKVKTNTLEKSKIDVSKIQISLRIGFALLQFSFLTFTKSFAMCTNSKEYWCIYLEYKICQL